MSVVVLLGCSHGYGLSVAPCRLQGQKHGAEAVWPTEREVMTAWHFAESVVFCTWAISWVSSLNPYLILWCAFVSIVSMSKVKSYDTFPE